MSGSDQTEILMAQPRGFCAGVDRAINIVNEALTRFGAPIYVRHEIVHNAYVVNDLRAKGAIFVDELSEVPAGATVIFSAHGVSPAVRDEAAERGDAVQFGILARHGDRLGVVVAAQHRPLPQLGHGDGEDARAAADIDGVDRPGGVERRQQLEAAARGGVRARAERDVARLAVDIDRVGIVG